MSENGRPGLSKTARILLLVSLYYFVVLLLGFSIRQVVAHTTLIPPTSVENILGGIPDQGIVTKKGVIPGPVDESTLAFTAALAMIASVVLVLPVIWIYTLTRAKRGYSQSVVHMLMIMPLVVAGVVVVVKY